MNIAILTTVHPALDGRIFHKEAISLASVGHNVTLFAPDHPEAASVAREHGIQYTPLPIIKMRLGRFVRWWRLLILLLKSQFDVWHFHDPELLPLAVIWRGLFSRKTQLVYDVHEDLPKNILDKPWLPKRTRYIISVLAGVVEHWCAFRCQLIVAATDAIGQRLAGVTRSTIVVRNYPLLGSRSQEGDFMKKENLIVQAIYCGTMTESRGIRETVEAMTYLHDCPVRLVLLGYFYPEAFEQEIRQLASDNVVILPQAPFSEVRRYLAESDIGIVVLRPTPSYVESLPIKLFEYMEAGLSVIASNFDLWREIVESNGCGVLVPPMDASQIAAAVRMLVRDTAMRKKMGQAGAKAVRERYSWQSQADELLRAYDQLASPIHSPRTFRGI